MYEGDHINCSSNGYPDVDYEWYCNGWPYTMGQEMVVDGDLLQGDSYVNSCNCTAMNYIDGLRLGATQEIQFYAYSIES